MARKSKTVEVEVPEVDQLPVEPDLRARLNIICLAERTVAEQIGQLQKTKDALRNEREPLIERIAGLGMIRVLGPGWDLRKSTRKSSRLNEDRIKMRLLQLGFSMNMTCVPCQGTGMLLMDEVALRCSTCSGTGRYKLEGLPAVLALVEECTDTTESTSWSVYGRD